MKYSTSIYDNYSLLSVKDLQSILHIGRNQAYALIKSGEIKCFHIGRSVKIPRICVDEYISTKMNAEVRNENDDNKEER